MRATLRSRAGALLALATGGLLLRLVLTGAHTAYVRSSTGWLLALAGVVLLLAGGSALLRGDEGHVHPPPRAAALLLLPLGLLVLVSPPALGAWYVAHAGAATVVTARAGDDDPLPAGNAPVRLSLRETLRRSTDGTTLAGRQVALTGFAGGADAEGRLLLTRLAVRCCAADAVPLQVAVHVAGPLPAEGTWLTVTAGWDAGTFTASSLQPVDEPEDTYEL